MCSESKIAAKLYAAGLLAVLTLAPAVSAQSANDSAASLNLVDCVWHTTNGATAVRRGTELEIQARELPRPAARTATCRARLTGTAPFAVRGAQRGSVTEAGWTFAFQRANGAVSQLNRSTQEGLFCFPVPLAWSRDREMSVVIGIPGDNPGNVRFQSLRFESASENNVQAPKPISPASGDTITPAATDFFWSAPPSGEARGYEVEYQQRGGPLEHIRIPAYFTSDAMRASPNTWPSPGAYQWRIRAISMAGSPSVWSRWTAFHVRAMRREAEPDIRPSAGSPAFLVNVELEDPRSDWQRLPKDIQSHTLLRIGGPAAQVENILNTANASGIPVALQVNGPHDIISGRWDRLPLSLLEHWAEKFANLKAFYICEQAVQGGIGNPEVREYLRRLIAIGAQSGRPVIWADANWGHNVWLDVAADADFSAFLGRHFGYVYPLWKMNGGFVPYLAPAGLLGLWLQNRVAGWGVQPESWYWTEAGFGALGTQRDFKEGVRDEAPLVLYQQLALLGVSAGAAIYSFEPSADFFDVGPRSGDNLQNILLPLLHMLLQNVIPDREEVRGAVRVWRQLRPADLEFRKGYSPRLRALFSETLGITYPFEEVPASGSSYWIPFVTGVGPRQSGGWHGTGWRTANAAEPLPTQTTSSAAVFRVGDRVFILNSRVNWDQEQTFSVELSDMNLRGVLGLNGWIIATPAAPGEYHLWLSGRPGARLELDFGVPVFWTAVSDGNSGSERPAARPEPVGAIQHVELTAKGTLQEFLVRNATQH